MHQRCGYWMPDCKDAERKAHKWVNGALEAYGAALPLVAKREFAIDLGAHCGVVSRAMCRDFREALAFEPIQDNIDCIGANAPTVRIVGAAAGAERGFTTFANNGSNIARRKESGDLTVRVERVDDWAERCDLMKIDVEGMELDALAGAKNVLKSRPVLIIEMKHNAAEIRAALHDLGYTEKWANHVDAVFVP